SGVIGRPRAHEPDHRHRRLLRARRKRPRRSCAADERDELAAFHSITSSARSRNGSGIVRPSTLAVVRLTTRSNLVGCSPPHSITSSARPSSIGGTSRPIALAALRLITNSNLVGCSTANSPGFAPLRILSTYIASRSNEALRLGP